jgi:hypothetical protein
MDKSTRVEWRVIRGEDYTTGQEIYHTIQTIISFFMHLSINQSSTLHMQRDQYRLLSNEK